MLGHRSFPAVEAPCLTLPDILCEELGLSARTNLARQQMPHSNSAVLCVC